jgi:glycosyltransferase involved in cell wall biosynthesis
MLAAAEPPLVSIVVPVLDEAAILEEFLDHLAALPGRFEVIIADGGSQDASVEIAEAHPLPARVVRCGLGRAVGMNAGAAAARGDPLLFLHADTRLPPTAYASLRAAIADTERALAPARWRSRTDSHWHDVECDLPDGRIGWSATSDIRSAEPTDEPRKLVAKVRALWEAKGYRVGGNPDAQMIDLVAATPDGATIIFGLLADGTGRMTLDGAARCVDTGED